MNLNLPLQCFAINREGQAIIITRGCEKPYVLKLDGLKMTHNMIDLLNRESGVTIQQREAMLAGVLLGWDSPAADPDKYDSEGCFK